MHLVHVYVQVRPSDIESFKSATLRNVKESLRETGVLRFDFVQQADDPTRFVLVEIYRSAEAAAAHKDTTHYQTWRDTVAPMMAAPRKGIKYDPVSLPIGA